MEFKISARAKKELKDLQRKAEVSALWDSIIGAKPTANRTCTCGQLFASRHLLIEHVAILNHAWPVVKFPSQHLPLDFEIDLAARSHAGLGNGDET